MFRLARIGGTANAYLKTMRIAQGPDQFALKNGKSRAHPSSPSSSMSIQVQWRAVTSRSATVAGRPSIHGERREPERGLFFAFPMQIPGKGDLEMEQRDWELLDKQMRGLSPPRNDAIIVLTVVAMFFAGMTLGGLLFPRQGEPMQIASRDATACDYPFEWCTTHHTAMPVSGEWPQTTVDTSSCVDFGVTRLSRLSPRQSPAFDRDCGSAIACLSLPNSRSSKSV